MNDKNISDNSGTPNESQAVLQGRMSLANVYSEAQFSLNELVAAEHNEDLAFAAGKVASYITILHGRAKEYHDLYEIAEYERKAQYKKAGEEFEARMRFYHEAERLKNLMRAQASALSRENADANTTAKPSPKGSDVG